MTNFELSVEELFRKGFLYFHCKMLFFIRQLIIIFNWLHLCFKSVQIFLETSSGM